MAIQLSSLLDPIRLMALFKNGTSIALEGPPGCGKSSVVRQMPRLLSELLNVEFGYMEQLVPSIDAPDVRGFMVPSKDEHGRAVARYTYPAILPTIEYLERHPYGVLFFDEWGQGDNLTLKGLAPLLLEGKIGDHQLPSTWLVITASNRMSDRSGVGKPMMHIVNRQRVLQISHDLNGWMKWAREEQIHPMGITFARQRPGVVFSERVPEEPRPFCTPRSFVSAMKLMQEMVGDSMQLPSDVVTQELVMGDIGEGAAAEFFSFIRVVDELPDIDDIKKRPGTCKVPGIDRLDAAYAAQQMLIHHAGPDCIDALWEYAMRLPKELQVSTALALVDKPGGLINSKALGTWLRENRALIINTTK
jgi:energy-coupling factor transporter ATP-binding protein EcfA2